MKYIINISEFNEIVNGIKGMKADLVCVSGNTLYGTDNNFTILKEYVMDTYIPVEPFTIITKTLSSEFYNNITDTNIVIDTDINKIYCANNTSRLEEFPEMINNTFNSKIERLILSLSNSLNINSIDFGEITNDEHFQRFKSIKAGEGADLYNPKGNTMYGMYLYSGAIPLTKQDKLYLEIYDGGNTFIANFIVHKKKLNPIKIYFRFLKMENSMYRA